MIRDQRNPEKCYVKVRADHEPDGRIVPLMFRAPDESVVRIDRIVDVREAPSTKLGGQGTRYTCLCGAREFRLFHDRDKWFVEE